MQNTTQWCWKIAQLPVTLLNALRKGGTSPSLRGIKFERRKGLGKKIWGFGSSPTENVLAIDNLQWTIDNYGMNFPTVGIISEGNTFIVNCQLSIVNSVY